MKTKHSPNKSESKSSPQQVQTGSDNIQISKNKLKELLFVIFGNNEYLNCRCKEHRELRDRLSKYLEKQEKL